MVETWVIGGGPEGEGGTILTCGNSKCPMGPAERRSRRASMRRRAFEGADAETTKRRDSEQQIDGDIIPEGGYAGENPGTQVGPYDPAQRSESLALARRRAATGTELLMATAAFAVGDSVVWHGYAGDVRAVITDITTKNDMLVYILDERNWAYERELTPDQNKEAGRAARARRRALARRKAALRKRRAAEFGRVFAYDTNGGVVEFHREGCSCGRPAPTEDGETFRKVPNWSADITTKNDIKKNYFADGMAPYKTRWGACLEGVVSSRSAAETTDVENLDAPVPVNTDPAATIDLMAPTAEPDQLALADTPDTINDGSEATALPEDRPQPENPFNDVAPYVASSRDEKARVLRIAAFIDERIELGFTAKAEKYAEIARFEAMSDGILAGYIAATEEFKRSANRTGSKFPVRKAASRTPSLGSASTPSAGFGEDPSTDYLALL